MALSDVRTTLQQTLGDAYQVERELGGGGMSRVFVATETSLGRRVVVKVLPPDLAAGVSIDRFRREIALAASMQHPHIVPLLAAGASAEPLWFTMPFIEGQSLRARLARGGELPIGEAVRILREVADALAYAHRHGVVHRDIKPENVLLSEGHAMVMDFGVAKAIAESSPRVIPMTDAGVALGTPTYMAPEQASADPHVDQRADIYAFGILAFELLTGEPPFSGASAAQVVRAHITEAAPAVTSRRDAVPPILNELVARCLAKRPADRPQSAEELLTALDTLATPTGAMPYISGAGLPLAPPTPWKKWGMLAAAVLVVGAVGLFAARRFSAAPARERIVVAPFTNSTGDKAFDELGTMIASWAQDAFTRSASFDVADFRALTQGSGEAKAVAIGSGATGLRAYADAAGATRVLTGSIFKLGDSLEFRATVVEPRQGTVVATITPVRALAKEPMRGVELLAERAAGALAVSSGQGVAKSAFVGAPHLPTMTAYREFTAGVEAYEYQDYPSAIQHFKAAVAADSAFLSSQVWLAKTYSNIRFRADAPVTPDSVQKLFEALAVRRSQLSSLDQTQIDARSASSAGDLARWVDAARRAADLWPDRYVTNLVQVLNYAGRPKEALEVAKTVDPTKGFLRGWATHYQTLAWSHRLRRDHESELKVAEEGIARFPDVHVLWCDKILALGALGRLNEADSLLRTVLPSKRRAGSESVGNCYGNLADIGVAGRPRTEADRAMRAYLAYLRSPDGLLPNGKPNRLSIAWAAARLGDYTTALAIVDSLVTEQPSLRGPLFGRALFRALAGDRDGARKTEAAALAIPRASTDRGDTEYFRAVIATALGDKEGAVRLLAECMQHGLYAWQTESINFQPLRGYPPFEALVAR